MARWDNDEGASRPVQSLIEIDPVKKLIVFDLDGTLAESKAKEAGVESIQVRDSNESKRVIEAILACLSPVRHSGVYRPW